MFQLVVPSDQDIGHSMSIQLPFFPTPFEDMDWKYGALNFSSRNLSGTKKESREFPMTFKFDKINEVDPIKKKPC